jgi:hypothetical protein
VYAVDLTGVCREDIVADYQLSGTYLRPFYKREMEQDTGLILGKQRRPSDV